MAFRRASAVWVAGALLVGIGLVVLWQLVVSPAAGLVRAEEALHDAALSGRHTEFRVTGLDHGPYLGPGGAPALDAAVEGLRRLARQTPGARTHHAYGRALLASGRPAEALAELRAAYAADPHDVALLSDLAAAQADSGDLVGALAPLDRAIAAEGPGELLPVLLFNRAVLNGRLDRRGQARDDFNRFLSIDADSKWAAESRERLAGLDPRP